MGTEYVFVVYAVAEGQGFIDSVWHVKEEAYLRATTLAQSREDLRYRVTSVPLDSFTEDDE